MSSIIKKIPDCKMKIIADKSKKFINLIKDLKLENNIEFTGFLNIIIESLYIINYFGLIFNIFPSVSECYPMALVETKLFGIPTIICGLVLFRELKEVQLLYMMIIQILIQRNL